MEMQEAFRCTHTLLERQADKMGVGTIQVFHIHMQMKGRGYILLTVVSVCFQNGRDCFSPLSLFFFPFLFLLVKHL